MKKLINRNKIFIINILFLMMAISFPISSQKQNQLNEIIIKNAETGGSISVSKEENFFFLKGRIEVELNGMILFANSLKYNNTTKELLAIGKIKIINKSISIKDTKNNNEISEKIIQGNSFYYNINTKSGIVYNGQAYYKPMFYIGDKIYIYKNTLMLKNSMLTSCDALNPHYHLTVSSIKILKDNQVIAYNVFYYVGGRVVFYWPLFVLTDMGTGILTAVGKKDSKGYFIQNTFYYNTPFFQENLFLPVKNKFTFDWYQLSGPQFSAQFKKEKSAITYDISMAVAQYKENQTLIVNNQDVYTSYFQESNQLVEKKETWYKVKSNFAYEYKNKKKKILSRLSVYYEYYNDKNFDLIYLDRIEPKNTPQMFSTDNNFNGLVGKDILNWYGVYEFQWDGLSLYTKMARNLQWYDSLSTSSNTYLPVKDVLPEVKIAYNKMLISSNHNIFKGIRILSHVLGKMEKDYSSGKIIKSNDTLSGSLIFPFYFTFSKFIAFTPQVGYTFNYEKPNIVTNEIDTQINFNNIQDEANRKTVQNFYNKNTLKLGNLYIYLELNHLLEMSFYQAKVDNTFDKLRKHYVNHKFVVNFLSGEFNVETQRDYRIYPYEIAERKRWSPIKINYLNELNLTNGFSFFKMQNTIQSKKKKEKFIVSGIHNITQYSIRYSHWINNFFQIYFKVSNIKDYIFSKIFDFKVTMNYMKNYQNYSLDYIDFSYEATVQLHKFWKLKIGSQSKAQRYAYNHDNWNNFWENSLQGLNFWNIEERDSSIFKLNNLFIHLEHDLHKWLLKISYVISKKEIPVDLTSQKYLGYYDHSIYLSLTLKHLNLGIPKSEIIRNTDNKKIF